ncbi:MAG TPA: 23S rRNA (guanosine(2251)-2'-O)-methyltransferase RlmB [Candidatus Limnocylindrales bacterium]|nr:23S rRNA (guanosine(2251)-2'-O)-methyltransferase RlmB [Candidatus Limnocylindrales bacterium]
MAGRRPVEEAFAARRPAIRLLVTPGRRQALERIVLHATTLRIPIVEVEGGTLTAIAGFDGHQGVALVVAPRRFSTPAEILARAIERGEAPFVLVLDSLEDPQNLGTVLRSAEAAGVHGVLFPTQRQAPLSPAAVKASAGATEHLLLAPVDDLAAALTDLHVRGVRVVGSEADAPLTVREADLRGPVAIVVGSEGHGLSPTVRRRCDLMVRIPMRGAIGSLNAAVAGSVLLFEALGQRQPDARPGVPAATMRPAPVPGWAGAAADVTPGAADTAPADDAAPPEGAAPTEDEVPAAPTEDAAPAEPDEPAPSPRPRRGARKARDVTPGGPADLPPEEPRDVPAAASADLDPGATDPDLLPGEAPDVPPAASAEPPGKPATTRRRRSSTAGSA